MPGNANGRNADFCAADEAWMAGTSLAMTTDGRRRHRAGLASWLFCLRLRRLGRLARAVAAGAGAPGLDTVIDRNGKLLRAYAMADGRWRLPVDAKNDVDPTYLKLLLAYEDQRFLRHDGVDPLALGRAALQLITRGHIVSGGSTITMQLARLMEPRRATLGLRQTAPDRARDRDRAAAHQGPDPRPLSRAGAVSAAISRASARPRSPISARSRSG